MLDGLDMRRPSSDVLNIKQRDRADKALRFMTVDRKREISCLVCLLKTNSGIYEILSFMSVFTSEFVGKYQLPHYRWYFFNRFDEVSCPV